MHPSHLIYQLDPALAPVKAQGYPRPASQAGPLPARMIPARSVRRGR